MKKRPNAEQRRQIDELMEVEAGSRAKAGIIGREWCEACGELGSFSGFRYCGGCGREVVIRPHRIEDLRRLPFTCPDCDGLDRGTAARRRHLEHAATQEGALEATAARIRWAKREIEEMLSDCESSKE
jgi:hypothetical protein